MAKKLKNCFHSMKSLLLSSDIQTVENVCNCDTGAWLRKPQTLPDSESAFWTAGNINGDYVFRKLYQETQRRQTKSPGWVAQLVGASSRQTESCRLDRWSGHVWEASSDVSLPHWFLSFSLPKNQWIYPWGRIKKKRKKPEG